MILSELNESNTQWTVNFNVLYLAKKMTKLFEILMLFSPF